MSRFDPFDDVRCARGAPMGRPDGDPIGGTYIPSARLATRHQGWGGDGYDRGGAYWGLPGDVWAVWVKGSGPDTVRYIRASSADDARAKYNGLPSRRYAVVCAAGGCWVVEGPGRRPVAGTRAATPEEAIGLLADVLGTET